MKQTVTIILLLTALLCTTTAGAQQQDRREETRVAYQQKMAEAKEAIRQWDIEHRLDSLDQEKLPKIVTGGLIGQANLSNFVITNTENELSSYMKVGGELGGFIDFRVSKHFAIQGRLLFTAEQNRFGINENGKSSGKHLWSFGIDIPVYFLGRFGNMEKGYLQFGAGPFTHFTFASNVENKYSNNLATVLVEEDTPMARVYLLHDNHSGLSATIGYEFPIGIQINANYLISLTDIFNYYKQEGTHTTKSVYPQRVSIGIGYRWK